MSSSRQISLSPDGSALFVLSEYNDDIRLAIKTLPGARWLRERRLWSVPLRHRVQLLEQLAPFGFQVDDAIETSGAGEEPESRVDTLSVAEVNGHLAATLAAKFPESFWVRGEISSFDRGVGRRHWYFELIEKADATDQVLSRLSAVIFERQRPRITSRLTAAGDEIQLRDGLSVRMFGRIDLYTRTGRIQFIVDDIDSTFSIGELAKRRAEILGTLAKEGLLNRNRGLPWPVLPLRIGLITARHSDAYHDFVKTLQSSGYPFVVKYVAAAVQGGSLEEQVVGALEIMGHLSEKLDVVVIIRGGGARSDLAWFDNLSVARRVARLPLKVIVGIGHERDRGVLDELAVSEKTPTAAAECLISQVGRAWEKIEELTHRLAERTRLRLTVEHQRRALYQTRLVALTTSQLDRSRYRLESLASRLSVDRLVSRLREIDGRLLDRGHRLASSVKHRLSRVRHQLELLETKAQILDPAQTLARGYAIIHNQDGALVREPKDAFVGGQIQVILHRGSLTAEVLSHKAHLSPNPSPASGRGETDRDRDPKSQVDSK